MGNVVSCHMTKRSQANLSSPSVAGATKGKVNAKAFDTTTKHGKCHTYVRRHTDMHSAPETHAREHSAKTRTRTSAHTQARAHTHAQPPNRHMHTHKHEVDSCQLFFPSHCVIDVLVGLFYQSERFMINLKICLV